MQTRLRQTTETPVTGHMRPKSSVSAAFSRLVIGGGDGVAGGGSNVTATAHTVVICIVSWMLSEVVRCYMVAFSLASLIGLFV